MVLNPTASADSHNWNYSKPENDGYSLELVGTVKAIQEVQAMNFGADGRPSTPKFWDNSGQPVMNIRMVLAGPSGGYRTWTFTPASKAAKEGKKKSVHLDLFALAGGVNLLDLVEKTIHIVTQAPPTGFNYGVGNPRPWHVELVTDQGPFHLAQPLEPIYLLPQVYGDQAVSGGQVHQQAPQPQVPQAPVSQAPAPGSPMMPVGNQMPAQAPAPQPMAQPPVPQGTPGTEPEIPF